MITPDYLRRGDRIALVAPAGKISRETVEAAIITLEKWGFEVVQGTHLYDNFFQYAASDHNRLADLQEALDDPSVKAILCARGGYGSIRLVDQLSFTAFKKHPKWMIGFSDITVLHAHIHNRLGIETLHGPMAAGLMAEDPASRSLQNALTGNLNDYVFDTHSLSRRGSCSGQLVGGNLAILTSLLGSGSAIETAGKILFIEDVGENLYRIDRMCWTLRRAGKLSDLAGLVVGGMTDLQDSKASFGKSAYEIIHEHVEGFSYPVCFGFAAGHQQDNRTLILGRRTTLQVGEKTVLGFSSQKSNT